MPVRPEEKIRCSFCGKNQDQVRKMIAGTNGVYICDECIELCSEILEEELGNEEERPDFSGINLLKRLCSIPIYNPPMSSSSTSLLISTLI